MKQARPGLCLLTHNQSLKSFNQALKVFKDLTASGGEYEREQGVETHMYLLPSL